MSKTIQFHNLIFSKSYKNRTLFKIKLKHTFGNFWSETENETHAEINVQKFPLLESINSKKRDKTQLHTIRRLGNQNTPKIIFFDKLKT